MAALATGNGFPNVVVTGFAMTTALATDADTTWQRLLDGQSGIRLLDDPFVEQYNLPVRIGGHLLEDFDDELTRVELRRLSYLQRMSTVLSRRVWEHAGSPEVDPRRLMVSIGTGMGSTEELLYAYEALRAQGPSGGVTACRADVHAERGSRRGRARTQGQGRGEHPDLGLRLGF